MRHTQPYARRRVEKAGQAANSNRGSGGALAGANAGGIAGSPTPSRQGPDRGRIGQAATIRSRPPQAAHSLRSEENTRASRVAHRSRWPQDRVLAEPSAADGSATGAAGTMRCGHGPGAPGPRDNGGDGAEAGGPERPVSPAVPSETAGDGWSHPTTAF